MPSDFNDLLSSCIDLGNSFPIMPIDEIRLAVAFTELPNQKEVVARLIRELFYHHNMHVRRIAVNACRRSQNFDVPGLQDALTEKLVDPEAWVRYDAARAIHDAKYDSPKIRDLLSQNAGIIDLHEGEPLLKGNPSNSELQSQIRSRKALNALLARENG
ncbi:MAG TPA: hypothetical protein VFR91_09075 [Dyella sp.]|nr:hypothetical protein [Dyella sp.]